MTAPPRLGIVGSSGGAALAAAVACLRAVGAAPAFTVVVDRDCGLADWAEAQGHGVHRVVYGDADAFSTAAANRFREDEVAAVLLFYTRRVGAPLFDALPTYNLHPSLLPAFKGLHGLDDALAAGVRVIGATLHGVTADIDGGPIVAQVATALPPDPTPAQAAKLSFLQKTWLTLVWYELLVRFGLTLPRPGARIAYGEPPPVAVNAAPALADPALVDAFLALQAREGARAVADWR